jgi:hypothetical protein
MATEVNVQENWVMEPELAETPPRRIVPSDYPDLNRPNAMMLTAGAGALVMGGIILLILGLNGKRPLLDVAGILVALAGCGVFYYVPNVVRKHAARAEHLVTNGVPVMARILSADNMSGDNRNARHVKYQVMLPGGDLVHREIKADDRSLPKRIPANVTALMDLSNREVELYCALPFRVISKSAPLRAARSVSGGTETPIATPVSPGSMPNTAPATVSANAQTGRMGTIGMDTIGSTPPPAESQPKAPEKPAKKDEEEQQPAPKPSAGLPWE